jgi:hypothetical protein
MLTATKTNTTSTRFSAASVVAGMVTPALSTAVSYQAIPSVWAQRRDLLGALEASRDIALRLGSVWDVLPGVTRKTLLDHAHELIDLTWRAQDRRGRYWGKPRRIMLRHPDMDLNALGAPR